MESKLHDLIASSGGEKAGEFVIKYGQEILIAATLFLLGLIAVKVLLAWMRNTLLPKFTENHHLISTLISALRILLIALVITLTLHFLGMKDLVIARLLFAIALVVIGFIVLLRPYIPTLPFKIGNRIEVGGLRGKVEAISFSHTRLRTREGKTLFIPNKLLLATIINNFHFTPTRRVLVKVSIGYKDDLLKAKQLLKEIMESDSRVREKPAPNVYVMELGDNGVLLYAVCWVENLKYLRVRSDMTERVKLRFDEEGITIPFPQLDVHMDGDPKDPGS
jgi:small conductance mechanosensitive channel